MTLGWASIKLYQHRNELQAEGKLAPGTQQWHLISGKLAPGTQQWHLISGKLAPGPQQWRLISGKLAPGTQQWHLISGERASAACSRDVRTGKGHLHVRSQSCSEDVL